MRVPQFFARSAAVAISVVAVSALAFSVSSSGAAAGSATGQGALVRSAPAAADQPNANDEPSSAPVAPAFQVAGRTSEMHYVPVTPCVLVDTRNAGGPLASGTTRSYNARGTGSLAGQGGKATGCGLPQNAAAIAASVSALSPSNPGFLRLNATDDMSAGISSVNYQKANITGYTNVNLSSPGGAKAFKVTNSGGPTGVQVTVVGYFIAPLAAEVASNGGLVIGARVTLARVIPGFTNQYEVIFDRDVSKCYYNATSFGPNLSAEVQPRTAQPNGVFVLFTNNAGAVTATQFYLTVIC